MVNEILFNQVCSLCNGDGYLTVTKTQWNEYLAWLADPTEEKANSTDSFPYFLKDLPNHHTVSTLRDKVTVVCTKCNGQKSVQQAISLDDLKKLLT